MVIATLIAETRAGQVKVTVTMAAADVINEMAIGHVIAAATPILHGATNAIDAKQLKVHTFTEYSIDDEWRS